MGDIAPRAAAWIELRQTAADIAREPLQLCPGGHGKIGLAHYEIEQIDQRALFDAQEAIGVKFAEGQFRIEQQAELGSLCHEADRYGGRTAVAAGEARAARRNDAQRAGPDNAVQCK